MSENQKWEDVFRGHLQKGEARSREEEDARRKHEQQATEQHLKGMRESDRVAREIIAPMLDTLGKVAGDTHNRSQVFPAGDEDGFVGVIVTRHIDGARPFLVKVDLRPQDAELSLSLQVKHEPRKGHGRTLGSSQRVVRNQDASQEIEDWLCGQLGEVSDKHGGEFFRKN